MTALLLRHGQIYGGQRRIAADRLPLTLRHRSLFLPRAHLQRSGCFGNNSH
jgi:hypothetical protein